jgi:hypothetical protein
MTPGFKTGFAIAAGVLAALFVFALISKLVK